MTTKERVHIFLTPETRDKLRALKRGGESYDATIRRIFSKIEEAELNLEPTT